MTEDWKTKGNDYWKEKLSSEQFKVCRKKGTEAPFTGELLACKEKGIYRCTCCKQELFHSEHKFDSGSGWPSFWAAFEAGKIRLQEDRSLFRVRTEVLCNRCNAHLGHVFDDGPAPTKKRYCVNSVALCFSSEDSEGNNLP